MLIDVLSFILVAVILIILGKVVIPFIKQCSLEVFVKAAISYAEENIEGIKKGDDRRKWVYDFLRSRFKWLDEEALRVLVQGVFDMMDKNGLVNTYKQEGIQPAWEKIKDITNISTIEDTLTSDELVYPKGDEDNVYQN